MKSFWRTFEYVWPQKRRLAVVIIAAVLVGFFFSLSFMSILPLLKVMMGEEGLHGWVDRKVCNWRYGLDFYIPDRFDFADPNKNVTYSLIITKIEEDSVADEAGLLPQDRIVAVGQQTQTVNGGQISSANLLENLAMAARDPALPLTVRRITPGAAGVKTLSLTMRIPAKNLAITSLQDTLEVLPRGEAKRNQQRAIIFIILAMGVVTIFRCFVTFLQKYYTDKVVQTALAHWRGQLFTHVMHMPIAFFVQQGTSDTTSRIMRDINDTGKGIQTLLGKTLREPAKAVMCLAGAFVISWQLTVVFLGMAPFVIGLFGILGKKIKRGTRKSLQTWSSMLARLNDVMSALRVVKVYNRQDDESTTYHQINSTLLRRLMRIQKVEAAAGPLMDFLGMVAGSAALIIGAHWVFDQNLSASSFFLMLILLGTTAESIRKVSDVWNKFNAADAASARVYEILDSPLEADSPTQKQLPPMEHSIEFRNITFTYPGSENPVLNEVSLTVPAGQTIAVVGPNGSGKTTLINLIPRFYDPDSGQILIDGRLITDYTLKSLRAQISMVTQNVVTFNDSIAANISYGKPSATREEIINAAKQSYAHEFIEPLPNGYDTLIGQQGSGFSGGQLQRIVIARAILKDPSILIFDEAMSQIDADSESKIHEALQQLTRHRTCFIIAHRFSTVISADTIAVMERGRIIAAGRHNELVESCPLYKSLYETQLM